MTNFEDDRLPDVTIPEAFQAILVQVAALAQKLDDAKDPAYEANLRRLVPSQQPLHATRLPAIRTIARDWLGEHRHEPVQQLLELAEVLWSMGWREERLLAILLIARQPAAMDAVDFKQLERWSREIDNWEQVDLLATITGRLLERNPRLLTPVRGLANSDSPWQRRLALVTLIAASRDDAWVPGLANMIERLQNDEDPNVKKAVAWARETLKKRQAKYV